jgi:hypothetical protein
MYSSEGDPSTNYRLRVEVPAASMACRSRDVESLHQVREFLDRLDVLRPAFLLRLLDTFLGFSSEMERLQRGREREERTKRGGKRILPQ